MNSEFAQDEVGEEQESAPAINPVEILIFIWESARRHRVWASVVGISIASLGGAIAIAVPNWYESEARILVEDSTTKTTSLLGSHGRDPRGADPVRESSELIRQKSKLASLVKDARLLANWESIRPLPLRMKDKIVSLVNGQMSAADKIEVLSDMLEDRLTISSDKGIVTVTARWRDARAAQKLAMLTKDMLIESLQTQEFSSINTAISLLDSQAQHAAEAIPPAREAVTRARRGGEESAHSDAQTASSQPAPVSATTVVVASKEVAQVGPSDAEIEQTRQNNKKLMEQLTEIRAQIRAVEAPWQRRLAELKLQLTDMLATLGPEHPNVVQQQSRIESATAPPPELQELHAKEEALLASVKGGDLNQPAGGQTSRVSRVIRRLGASSPKSSESNTTSDTKDNVENPAVTAAFANLQSVIAKYTEIAGRADAARFELMIAQVAFQHQYVVVREPEVPKAPKKNMRRLVLLASFAVAGIAALLLGALRDLLTGRVLAPWQVKLAGLQTIGELRLPGKTT